MPAPPSTGPIVIGVLYPPAWFGGDEAVAAAAAAVEAFDPRIEVVVETYEEGQHQRTLRGRIDGTAAARAAAPELTDARRLPGCGPHRRGGSNRQCTPLF